MKGRCPYPKKLNFSVLLKGKTAVVEALARPR
jgi:hypothetical protein